MTFRSIPINPAPYAKLQPSPSDIRMAAEQISLILSVCEIDCSRVIESINANIDKAELLKSLHAYLSDCNGELVGPIDRASEELSGDLYTVSTRGPFYRRRGGV